jgi:hypothetical protein
MIAHRIPVVSFVLLCCAACSQGRGESCQVDRDCESGLVCFSSSERGTCEPPGERDAGKRDAAPDIDPLGDAAIRDAAADGG